MSLKEKIKMFFSWKCFFFKKASQINIIMMSCFTLRPAWNTSLIHFVSFCHLVSFLSTFWVMSSDATTIINKWLAANSTLDWIYLRGHGIQLILCGQGLHSVAVSQLLILALVFFFSSGGALLSTEILLKPFGNACLKHSNTVRSHADKHSIVIVSIPVRDLCGNNLLQTWLRTQQVARKYIKKKKLSSRFLAVI